MILHTSVPQDMISDVIAEDLPEYIKYNGQLCLVRRTEKGRVIERLISTDPGSYLRFEAIGRACK